MLPFSKLITGSLKTISTAKGELCVGEDSLDETITVGRLLSYTMLNC